MGDDRHRPLRDRGARSRDRPHAACEGQRKRAAPGRAAVPLGLARAHDRRLGKRPRAHGARSERAHSGGQGVHVRHPSGTAPARRAPDAVRQRDQGACAVSAADYEQPRVGFFTDTSVCIGCKACEVACKEWNVIPEDGLLWTGESYDNTSALGANSWRHVAFIEQEKPLRMGDDPLRWLMSSDVCKHCTHAACLDVCPTGALFRTEFGTVVVQEDICNGCGYCVPACPFGVLDKRHLPGSDPSRVKPKEDGRVWKCTLCYDRLKGGHEPACAKACPTDSIQFGELDELRERARERLEKL